MEHLMIDLETMANESFSAIISLAAVEFDINTGQTGKEFYINISLQSCIDLGLIVNADTIMWWMKQTDEARKSLLNGTVHIVDALTSFSGFCNKDYQVWGNSARFDLGILQNAYNKAKLPICWDFKKERCVRTLVSFKPEIKANFKYLGVGHNALADCYNQIAYCHLTWSKINS
ncbi:3'-5' exonuclease [Flavobacterium fluviatile]|uniref:3'-5' exonuclease n=1 Tax=Flavobacterium fluviatile TaxID=1862387 RepID=UPI0013CF5271|nr:3'-5' exonuclease [Flavobacterium fluviatile]